MLDRIYIWCISIICFSFNIQAQSFSTSSGTLDIYSGTNYSSCGSPGTKSISINVSGLSTLSSTNALGQIKLSFSDLDGTGGGSLRVSAYLKSPSGTCVKVFDGITPALSTAYSGTLGVTMTSSASCSNTLNTSNLPISGTSTSYNQSGQYGVFSTGNDLTGSYSGENPNGNWVLYFYTTSADPVEFLSGTLTFGNPTVSDQTSNGDNCTTAINWNGSPICASTNTKTASSNMPGWAGPGASSFGTFSGGVTCSWNGSNDNDTWIKFTAQSSTVCVNISGLDQSLQSVVVTDPNTDGDNNPCTGSGAGQYWQLVSCPDQTGTANDIYTGTAGTQKDQNHCFTATPGQTYYLVIDGNGGAESPFFVNGLLGTAMVLPIELIDFTAQYSKSEALVYLKWQTSAEIQNDYFSIERSTDGVHWKEISRQKGAGTSNHWNSYMAYDANYEKGINYYRLKQTDYNKKASYSKIAYINAEENSQLYSLYPNPNQGEFNLYSNSKNEHDDFVIVNMMGQVIQEGQLSSGINSVNIQEVPSGIYFIKISGQETIKLIKQ